MSKKSRPYYTVADYFSVEDESGIKHEYLEGQIYAMVGASLNHNQIKENVSLILGSQLKNTGCRVLSSDMKVKTGSGLYTYPDLLALCTKPDLEKIGDKQSLLNPSLIVEILSKSTKDYDKVGKFEHYKTISSFNEYLLVDQYEISVTACTKQSDGKWLEFQTTDLATTIALPIIKCQLALKDIYALVDFDL